MKNHTWSDDDNLIAYRLYRFGDSNLNVTKKELGDILGMALGSLSYKTGNFKAIDGKGDLNGYSAQAVRIYKQYHILSDKEVRIAGAAAVVRAIGSQVKDFQEQLANQKA